MFHQFESFAMWEFFESCCSYWLKNVEWFSLNASLFCSLFVEIGLLIA